MLALFLSAALAGDCVYVGKDQVEGVAAPAVVVLGERHGMQPDLRRAATIVRSYAARGPTTVALEAAHRDKQRALDDFAAGRVDASALPERLDWGATWGFPFPPYRPLVTASAVGAEVVAAGVALGGKPEGAEVPIPPRYVDLLRDAMGGHPVPLGQESRFVEAMAWRDFAIAEAAIAGWDGKGWLVIVTGRGHVEGGKGVAWQAARLTDARVEAFVLARGQEPPCHPGDRIWR
jgi:hypothetical protein